jgi:hypothetical protein
MPIVRKLGHRRRWRDGINKSKLAEEERENNECGI